MTSSLWLHPSLQASELLDRLSSGIRSSRPVCKQVDSRICKLQGKILGLETASNDGVQN